MDAPPTETSTCAEHTMEVDGLLSEARSRMAQADLEGAGACGALLRALSCAVRAGALVCYTCVLRQCKADAVRGSLYRCHRALCFLKLERAEEAQVRPCGGSAASNDCGGSELHCVQVDAFHALALDPRNGMAAVRAAASLMVQNNLAQVCVTHCMLRHLGASPRHLSLHSLGTAWVESEIVALTVGTSHLAAAAQCGTGRPGALGALQAHCGGGDAQQGAPCSN